MTTTAERSPSVEAPARRPIAWGPLLAGLLVVLALGGGLLLGRGMTSGVERIDNPVDVGFAQDMKIHHAQAVEMSAIVHARTADPGVSYLALDILTTQQGQIGIMTGWLDLWRQTQTSTRPVMSWMGHSGQMAGMATDDEIAALKTLPDEQMEEQFLRLMIRHHAGALPMAAYVVEHGSSPELVGLARGMEQGQAAEIDLMQSMLMERGWEMEPGFGHSTH
jgi:uncharacterized protein (DUF305 family)